MSLTCAYHQSANPNLTATTVKARTQMGCGTCRERAGGGARDLVAMARDEEAGPSPVRQGAA